MMTIVRKGAKFTGVKSDKSAKSDKIKEEKSDESIKSDKSE